MLTPEKILELIESGESQIVEFKSSVVAFGHCHLTLEFLTPNFPRKTREII